ncbi:GvpL/GvpF family gas vesicle protein [Halobacillus sp. BBL2006]|uniref:GvpL/GvpF family gas vesicle protein n=1 Tax=Halobacillus sp. BBL2006 TaxID=1543706 RepID=UPI0005430719|nr:GvpL/GvpF family gas vesicle protein [Halobacillus sp. BBL2006]KHE72829.1 hypothetical protein LD39_02510 [Halobacillus sp. BBL2006]
MSKLLYLYGIIPKQVEEADSFPDIKGIDGQHSLSIINFNECAAVVCPVNKEEYGEEVLEEKTKQMDWVQEKAFHHHEALISLRERTTIIPMKFCTIFQNEDSLSEMIHSRENEWESLLHELENKEEWNVKIYCDPSLLKEEVAENNLTIKNKKAEIAEMSKGRQYLERKKLDQLIDQEVEQEQHIFSKGYHDKWKDLAAQDAVKKVWNKDVTGKDEEMCWNSAYLLPIEHVESFLENVTVANKEHASAGWKFEITGPWPAYHFVNLSKSEV